MPPNGTYAELHTPDQGVRLLASSNLEKRGNEVFSCFITDEFPHWANPSATFSNHTRVSTHVTHQE